MYINIAMATTTTTTTRTQPSVAKIAATTDELLSTATASVNSQNKTVDKLVLMLLRVIMLMSLTWCLDFNADCGGVGTISPTCPCTNLHAVNII